MATSSLSRTHTSAARRVPHHAARPTGAPWLWACAGVLCGTLAALLVFAPARWLATAVFSASAGHVRLDQARGTVWDGSAQLVFTGGANSFDTTALPGRTAWQLRPAWNGLHARLEATCCTPQPLHILARPRWGGAQVQLHDSQTQWPAAMLAGLGTPWNTVQAQGQLGLTTQGLEVQWAAGRALITGQARLDALHMSSRLSTLQPMGSYRITFTGGPTPAIQLATLEGALQLSGSGQWVGARLHFSGEASATPEREAALANLLNIIGRRTGARSIISL